MKANLKISKAFLPEKKITTMKKCKKMNKQILSIAFGLVLMAFTTTTYAADKTPSTKITASEKAQKNFGKQFNYPVSSTLYSASTGFIVQAQVSSHKVTSAYDKKGNWVYTIKRYPTESLAKNIIDIVKSNYDDNGYFISTMEQIDQPGSKSVYIVHLENGNSFKTLRVTNGEVELVQDFQKA